MSPDELDLAWVERTLAEANAALDQAEARAPTLAGMSLDEATRVAHEHDFEIRDLSELTFVHADFPYRRINVKLEGSTVVGARTDRG